MPPGSSPKRGPWSRTSGARASWPSATVTRREVESVARIIFDWLQTRCAADSDYASGNTYERAWTDEITALLIGRGKATTHQQCYPGSRKTCDVVTSLPKQTEFWI